VTTGVLVVVALLLVALVKALGWWKREGRAWRRRLCCGGLCGVSGGVGGSRAGGASSNGAAKSKLAEAFGLLGHAAKVGVDAAKGIVRGA